MVNSAILPTVAPAPPAAATVEQTGPAPTANIIASMLQAAPKTSDLIFSPGRAPQVELHGQLMQLKIKGVGVLSAEDTARIAADLIGTKYVRRGKIERGRLLRHFLQRGPAFAFSREYLHAARQLRDRDARHSQQRAGFQVAEPAGTIERRGASASRNRAGDWPDGKRKILDAGGVRQQDQRRESLPRNHHRRPDRISAPAQAGDDSSARTVSATRRVSRWRCAPPCGRRRS